MPKRSLEEVQVTGHIKVLRVFVFLHFHKLERSSNKSVLWQIILLFNSALPFISIVGALVWLFSDKKKIT